MRKMILLLCIPVIMFTACPEEPTPGGDPTYTVKFNLGYETTKRPPADREVKEGDTTTLPTPVRPLWDFTGWEDAEGNTYTKDTPITKDVTLTANWNWTPGPTNPIFRDRYTTDPAPMVVDDTLYVFTGEDYVPPGENFYFMPRWHIYSTKDMKEFKYEGVVANSEDFPGANRNSAWAGQCAQSPNNGKFYFYGTVAGGAPGGYYSLVVAVADEVTGPYTPIQERIVTTQMVVQDITGYPSTTQDIDPTVFIDDDGKAYICWGKDDWPLIAELNTDDPNSPEYMTTIKGPIRRLFQDDYYGDHMLAEGPWLYKRNGWYYCIYPSFPRRENGTVNRDVEHMAYARAESIDGPWEFGRALSGAAPGSFTIHPGVVDFLGMTFIFHHNGRLSMTLEDGRQINGGSYWRSVCVDYLYYDEETGHFEAIDTNDESGISVPPRDQ